MQFLYTNLVPEAARPGTCTNLVDLRWDGTKLVYSRSYVLTVKSTISDVSEDAINNTLCDGITAENVARKIHWGCCGWDAAPERIWHLTEHIRPFIERGPVS